MEKETTPVYVLVNNLKTSVPFYYTGILFKLKDNTLFTENTDNFILALKLPFKDEAEKFCDSINSMMKELKLGHSYHIEEHQYM